MTFDVERIRKDFPNLHTEVYGKPLVYLDNAATTHKPTAVLDAYREFYEKSNSNVHRGVHALSQRATDRYEHAREVVRRFLNARHDKEIVFVRGTTEAVNLVANTIGRQRLTEGTEILITGLEHHSNIVPWQLICAQTGATLKVVPIDDDGDVPLERFEEALSERTRFVSIAHISNSLGTVLPVKAMVQKAKARGIPVLVDGAQAASHSHIDVQDLGCDFYAISGHKVFAPTGIGALYGRWEVLSEMPPYHGGGEMIRTVSFEGSTWAPAPARFEAGTPNIGGAVALGAALDYLMTLDREALRVHEADLLSYGTARLSEVEGLRMIGSAPQKTCVFSFVIDGVHPHDIGTIVDRDGVAVRAGHHCAQPVMAHFGVPATTRASLAMYNTRADIDALVRSLQVVKEMFG